MKENYSEGNILAWAPFPTVLRANQISLCDVPFYVSPTVHLMQFFTLFRNHDSSTALLVTVCRVNF